MIANVESVIQPLDVEAVEKVCREIFNIFQRVTPPKVHLPRTEKTSLANFKNNRQKAITIMMNASNYKQKHRIY